MCYIWHYTLALVLIQIPCLVEGGFQDIEIPLFRNPGSEDGLRYARMVDFSNTQALVMKLDSASILPFSLSQLCPSGVNPDTFCGPLQTLCFTDIHNNIIHRDDRATEPVCFPISAIGNDAIGPGLGLAPVSSFLSNFRQVLIKSYPHPALVIHPSHPPIEYCLDREMKFARNLEQHFRWFILTSMELIHANSSVLLARDNGPTNTGRLTKISTGQIYTVVSRELFETLSIELQVSGFEVTDEEFQFRNCQYDSLPNLVINIFDTEANGYTPSPLTSQGWGTHRIVNSNHILSIVLNGEDYLIPRNDGGCSLIITPEDDGPTQGPFNAVLGAAILSFATIMFDLDQNRIGFCEPF